MIRIKYNDAVEAMKTGLMSVLPETAAERFARIFADNSADGVASHGMNRYPRYINDIRTGLCDASVLNAERVGGFGGLEIWDAHFGVGPLIADQISERVVELAREYGIACCALRNNSHWLRAGRYAKAIGDQGLYALCFTNTCMNLAAWGTKEPSTGNNPVAMAIPRSSGTLLMDMAVSQYSFGKIEIMAQEGKMLDVPCGYDTNGTLTCDPVEINRSKKMIPMAMWKGSALSIMLDFMAAGLSGGRTSREIGVPAQGEAGLSQIFIAMDPSRAEGQTDFQQRMEESIAFFHGLTPSEQGAPRIPGENLARIRETNMREGIPVTEATWAKICEIRDAGKACDGVH